MSNFWPIDINLNDTASPREILENAKQEWAERSDGLLTLVIQEAERTTENHMLIVHAKHVPSNRTVTLFSVLHRPGAPYPAGIQPRDSQLPDILKKNYYQPGLDDDAERFSTKGQYVTNKWVCDTPAEFRMQLKEVFNLGTLKSDVLSLVSGVGARSVGSDNTAETGNACVNGRDDVEPHGESPV